MKPVKDLSDTEDAPNTEVRVPVSPLSMDGRFASLRQSFAVFKVEA